MMATEDKKPLMRCLGEFVGHILHAVKSDATKREVNRTIEEQKEANMTLRRTTIDEIEIRQEEPKND
jgi:hypothetical protein